MNKQEFIDEIAKKGVIDLDKVTEYPPAAYDVWLLFSKAHLAYFTPEFVASYAVYIDNVKWRNPPDHLIDIKFYDNASGMYVDELDTQWLMDRIDELPFVLPLQKATVLSSAGIFGYVRNKEVIAKKSFGSELDKLSLATLFVNACKAELSIAGEKVGESEAGYNKIATEAIDLGEIATDGKNLEIELKCAHVIGSGIRYNACASIVGN